MHHYDINSPLLLFIAAHGIGVNLLKISSKRKRTKQQLEDAKFAEQEDKDHIELVNSENEDLKRELELVKAQMAHSQKAQDFADTMIKEGYVKTDEFGDIVQVSE